MKTLALDIGNKRIGVAASDTLGILASPLTVIHHESDAKSIDAILHLSNQEGADEIVVGLPISLDGKHTRQTRSVASFISKLEARSPVTVTAVDERFSTMEAKRLLSETKPVKGRSRGEIDAAAAAVILQSYLDGPGAG